MKSSVEGRAGSAALFNSVQLLGTRRGTDLVGLFKGADVVCVPSRNEPFGIVVLEACGTNKPVVVTCNGGPREFVKDQKTGWEVEPNAQSLGWALAAAIADKPNADRIAANGRHEAEARFSWDAIGAIL